MTAAVTVGPVVRRSHLAALASVPGRWQHPLSPVTLPIGRFMEVPFTVGVYLLMDSSSRLVRLGQACRDDDVVGRIRDHLRVPDRATLIERLHVVGVNDQVPRAALDCIEGRAADLLGCRGRMGALRWPSAANWERLCRSDAVG